MQPHDSLDFSILVDLLLDVICAVDENNRFVRVSAACEQVFGYTQEEMIGRPMLDFVHPDDRQRTLKYAASVKGHAPRPYFENRYLRKDGTVAHIMWSAAWSEHDRLRIAAARDVSGHKREEVLRTALLDISEAVHHAKDLQDLFAHIHRCISELLPARNFFIALLDDAGENLHFPYHVDEYDARPEPVALSDNTPCGEVVRSGKTLLLTSESGSRLRQPLQPLGRAALHWLGVPLIADERVTGLLAVQSYTGQVRYSEHDKEILQFVSNQVALAVERKRLQQKLEHLALHDPLTNLPNRRLFLERLNSALLRGQRYQERFALVFLDLDRFKEVNDRYGHVSGDCLLQQVGRRLEQSVRVSDTVARLGGDEFVLLLENLSEAADAEQLVNKLREAFGKDFPLPSVRVSIRPSTGIALYPDDGQDEHTLLAVADRRMYEAKQAEG
ncbi:MAG TPA: diguanylate cyclase [Pseudomonadaceae bacterium]|nr:diguanylate cyclase [Pseudomonadaceae bacterium]